MVRHGLKEFGNYSWKQKFRIVCNKKFWFSFRFSNTKFLFVVASELICWGRCGLVGKSQSMLLIKFLPTILLLRFYNNKSCCYRLRWNCRKESWWSWYHRFPSLGKVVLCRRRHKRRWQWHCCHLIHSKKNAKKDFFIRKEEEKGAYLQAPTFTTTLKLLLLSRSCCHHVEAPLVGALLKLPTLEAHVDFALLKLWATQALFRLEALVMEASAKGGGWGGGQQDEGGRWVGRKKGGRWVVGRSFPKNTWGQGWAKKKVIKKTVPRKKTELEKKI